MASLYSRCHTVAQDCQQHRRIDMWADLVTAAAPLPAQLASRRNQLKGNLPQGYELVNRASILQLPVEVLQQAHKLSEARRRTQSSASPPMIPGDGILTGWVAYRRPKLTPCKVQAPAGCLRQAL